MTDYQTPDRMALKERAIPLPDFAGKTVLDVGCDHGHWCWLAAQRGAKQVFGIDRGRKVHGVVTNLARLNQSHANDEGWPCRFAQVDIGRQWHEYGQFDVVLCFSMYHHIFQNCHDHEAIWYWLWRHTYGELLWENPTGEIDPVVRQHVRHPYRRADILEAAKRYFVVEYVGPALHVATREVWRCTPLQLAEKVWKGQAKEYRGPGGATAAFLHAGGRRMDELGHALGQRILAGSLNVTLDEPFDWDARYYRTLILDAKDRANIEGEWAPRWLRLYPVEANGVPSFAFRFEGEKYPPHFVELVSDTSLRQTVKDDGVVRVRSC